MDWIGTIVGIITGGGVAGVAGTIYGAKKSAQVGMSGNEVEAAKAKSADWASYSDRIEKRIVQLELKVDAFEAQKAKDEDYIDILQNHIWMRMEPPPPPRPAS